MKTMSVRFSELEQKRLSDLAIKRGGTVSDSVREIIGKYFEDLGKVETDKAEHDKTRAAVRDVDNALASTHEEIQAVKNALENFKTVLAQYVAIAGGVKK